MDIKLDSEEQGESKADSTIFEGKAKIYKSSDVFYNKVQEFNRDLRFVLFEYLYKFEWI